MKGEGSDHGGERTRDVGGETSERVLRFTALDGGSVFAERYAVEGRLGGGGTGEVFAAHDRVADEPVALKVLYPRPGARDPLDRLRRELRILRGLQHPGIVRIHDIGEHDGLAYLVMDRLDGETVAERLHRTGPLPLDAALRILDGILDALAAAHEAGIVHRDVKPQNVFLCARDERVVLLDFGLARGIGDATLTATGQFLGTPEYVSPEQARGDAHVTPASDVFSCGLVLCAMLGGKPAASDSSPITTLTHRAQGGALPSRRDLPALPRWVRELLEGCFEADPRDRPADAEDLLERLRGKAGLSATGRARRAGRTLVRLARRRRSWIAAGALLAILALAALVPWRIEADGGRAVTESPLGIARGAIDLPGPASAAVKLDPDAPWDRRYLVDWHVDGRVEPGGRRPAMAGLAFADALTGRTDPLEPQFGFRSSLEQMFPLVEPWAYLGLMHGPQPFRTGGGGRLLLARADTLQYPSVLLAIDPDTLFERQVLLNPGGLSANFALVACGADPSDDLVVLAAFNLQLSSRFAVVAVRKAALGDGAGFVVPPFANAPQSQSAPDHYVWASFPVPMRMVAREGTVALPSLDGREFRVDVCSGTPLTVVDNGGDGAAERWRRDQDRLLRLLRKAAAWNAGVDAAATAGQLTAFADRGGTWPGHRGVALARAAELLRLDGRPAGAIPLARRALEAEPEITGHADLLIDLHARTDDWPAISKILATFPDTLSRETWIQRNALLAALLLREGRSAVELRDELGFGFGNVAGYYPAYIGMLTALHDAQPEQALLRLEQARKPYAARYPGFAFLEALALVTSEPPRLTEAHERLQRFEGGWGEGHAAPDVPLRAVIAAQGVGEPVPPAAVVEALKLQRREARRSLMSLYFVPWAEALAARAARERGDEDGWRRHLERARRAPGAGPYVERLAGN
jgi:hypothetical protein